MAAEEQAKIAQQNMANDLFIDFSLGKSNALEIND